MTKDVFDVKIKSTPKGVSIAWETDTWNPESLKEMMTDAEDAYTKLKKAEEDRRRMIEEAKRIKEIAEEDPAEVLAKALRSRMTGTRDPEKVLKFTDLFATLEQKKKADALKEQKRKDSSFSDLEQMLDEMGII